jgi:hypothetical protein
LRWLARHTRKPPSAGIVQRSSGWRSLHLPKGALSMLLIPCSRSLSRFRTTTLRLHSTSFLSRWKRSCRQGVQPRPARSWKGCRDSIQLSRPAPKCISARG